MKNYFALSSSDSEAATHLESEKKTARSKTDVKRRKFQAQDSVLKESLKASLDNNED